MRSGLLVVLCVLWAGTRALQPGVVVLVDPFTSYLSGHCREYCAAHDIEIVEAVSPYTASILASSGRPIPDSLRAPEEGEEKEWAETRELHDGVERRVLVISESDAGVSTAERIQVAIGATPRGANGICPHLRNKFEQNERAARRGLPIVAQTLASSWQEAEAFLAELWKSCKEGSPEHRCIIKPCRGVASDGVFLCSSLSEARAKFEKLLGSPKYGSVGDTQESVLVQEFADGTEYAVDTVTCDGETKVVALWRYSKFSANGAPFVYQCSELVGDSSSEECRQVMDYVVAVLDAQDLVFGPTHTECKFTAKGPRLMEVNARWHAQHFRPITQSCLGNDALEITMDAFFQPERFAALPSRPVPFAARGLILHLVSFQQGSVAAVRHSKTIEDLRSCLHLSVDYEPGMQLVKTVDIRTDCGYVLLAHKDPKVVEADYRFICDKLQKDLFVLEGESVGKGEGEGEGGVEDSVRAGSGAAVEAEDGAQKADMPKETETDSAVAVATAAAARDAETEVEAVVLKGEGAAAAEEAGDEEEGEGGAVEEERGDSRAGQEQEQGQGEGQGQEQRQGEGEGEAGLRQTGQTMRRQRAPRSRLRRRAATFDATPGTVDAAVANAPLSAPDSSSWARQQPQLQGSGFGPAQQLNQMVPEESLGQRILIKVLKKLRRTAVISAILLGLGYTLALAVVLLIPEARD